MAQFLPFSTSSYPPEGRLTALRTTLDRLVVPGDVSASNLPAGELEVLSAGPTWTASRMTCTPMRVVHQATHVADANAQSLLVWLQIRGTAEFVQGGAEVRAVPGDLVVRDAAYPSAVDVVERSEGIIVRLAKANGLRNSEALLKGNAARLKREAGSAIVLRQFLRSLTEASRSSDEIFAGARHVIAQLLLDAVAQSVSPVDERQSLELVIAAIRSRCAEPDLRVAAIAEDCRISKRKLHNLLMSQGLQYRSVVREMRLERARSLLMEDTSITSTCFRSGFNDAAHFSRAFKERYGVSPREYKQALNISDRT